jgi:cytochrome c
VLHVFFAPALILALTTPNAFAQGKGDPVAGAEVFKKCEQCHSIGETIKAGNAGPALNGVIGRKSAYEKEFNYSPPMRSARLTWDEPTLARFLKSPKGLIAGTRMLFPGLSSPKDIEDVIAFMGQYDELGRKKQ